MRGRTSHVKFVSFGYDSYYIAFEDGSASWAGIPKRLADLVNSRWGQARYGPPTFVSLSPHDDDDYFVARKHGKDWNQNGIPINLNKYNVTRVYFGADGGYLVQGTDKSFQMRVCYQSESAVIITRQRGLSRGGVSVGLEVALRLVSFLALV